MMPKTTAAPAFVLRSETAADAAAVDALIDRAFGPGRFVKSSERVREVAEFRPDLSVCALEAGRLVGSVRMWRVHVGPTPAIFLGPIAVEAGARSAGVGALLVDAACQAAEAAGFPLVVLVGDIPYFGRFGFSNDHTRAVRLPGPVDQRRVLSRGATAPLVGPVTA
jgi:predicted N-acetyltransferase YhbS